MKNILSKNLVLSLLLFLISFLIYFKTTAPSLYIEDSAEFVTAAVVLGVAHPPGYPLFSLVGHLFSFLPFGSVAFRLNLVSVFFAALTIAILYLIFIRLQIKPLISFLVALNFSVTYIFWQEATYAEVYTLNLFFVSLTLYFLLTWWFSPKIENSESQSKNYRPLLLFSFFYGLSLTNHFSMLALAPAYGLFILLKEPKIFRQPRLLLKLLILFVLPLSLYLYLPLRSAQNPPLDWYNPETLSGFYQVLAYDFSFGHRFSLASWRYFGEFANNIFSQFGPVLTGLGLLGLLSLWRQNKKLFFGLFFSLLLTSLGVIMALTNGRDFEWGVAWFLSIIYLPAYLIFSFFIAWGIQSLILAKSKNKTRNFTGLISVVLVISFSWLLFANWLKVDKSQYFFVYDYYQGLLESLEPNAFLVLKDHGLNRDVETFSLLYLQAVEKIRPDVTIISDSPVFYRPDILPLPENYFQGSQTEKRSFLITEILSRPDLYPTRAIYTTFPADVFSDTAVISRSNGFAYRLYQNFQAAQTNQTLPNPQPLSSIRGLNNSAAKFDYYTKEFLAKYFYHLASFYWENNDKERGSKFLQRAIGLDNQPFSQEYSNFIQHRNNWLQSQAGL